MVSCLRPRSNKMRLTHIPVPGHDLVSTHLCLKLVRNLSLLRLCPVAERRRSRMPQEAGSQSQRPTEMDLYAVIVKNGFRNTPDDSNAASRLVAFLKAHGTPALVAYAFKNRAKLPGLIDDVWSWEKVDAYLEAHAKSRLDQLYAAAAMPCMCQGRWALQALEALSRNSLCPPPSARWQKAGCSCHGTYGTVWWRGQILPPRTTSGFVWARPCSVHPSTWQLSVVGAGDEKGCAAG